MVRVVPAQQRFHADRLALRVHLHLVVQRQLLRGNGATQRCLQRRARLQLGLQHGVVKAVGVAPGRLGLVHGSVGTLEQILGRTHAGAEQAHAQAGAGQQHAPSQVHRPRHRRQHLLRQCAGLLLGLDLVGVQGICQHHEFVATQARHQRLAAHRFTQVARHVLQVLVAHLVAQGVVDGLEVIQIHQQQRAMAG